MRKHLIDDTTYYDTSRVENSGLLYITKSPMSPPL